MLTGVLALMTMRNPSSETSDPLSPESLKATVAHLASYPTRNTNSPEMEKAVTWIAGEFGKIPGVRVERMRYTVTQGRRIVATKEVSQVLAWLEPTVSPEKAQPGILAMGGHLDTINLSGDPMTAISPGANDDASGVAATLAVCRAMASRPRARRMLFIAFTGEEQGLLGSTAIAKRAKAEGWPIEAVLSNDTVGSPQNLSGQRNDRQIRVFSEEAATHQSRELARFLEVVARSQRGLGIKLVFRKDRFGRGGDHTPFNNEGFTAVRFIEVHEEYSRQHTVEDRVEYVDFGYLSKVAALNLRAMEKLANAGKPPSRVVVDQSQGHDTTLRWEATPGVKYVVYWRDTAQPTWKKVIRVGAVATYKVAKVNKDDHVFAVGAEGGIPVLAR